MRVRVAYMKCGTAGSFILEALEMVITIVEPDD